MSLEGFSFSEEKPVIDGLQYFPKLRKLTICYAVKVVVKNQKSLQEIQVRDGNIDFNIEICGNLSLLELNNVKGSLTIRDCGELGLIAANQCDFDEVSITGTKNFC